MRAIAVATAFLASCVQANATHCDGPAGGYECPASYACAPSPVFCGTAPEVHACAGHADRDPCSTGAISGGVCLTGVCTACSPDVEGCTFSGWQAMTSGTAEDLQGLWVAGPGDAYAAGAGGTILHYDGRAWSPVAFPTQDPLGALWGTGSGALFVLDQLEVYAFSGAWAPTMLPATNTMDDLTGIDASTLVAVGFDNQIWERDGATWAPQTPNLTTSVTLFRSVWAGTSDVYVVGLDGAATAILHRAAGSWSRVAPLATPFDALAPRAVWGTSDGRDVFVAGAVGNSGAIAHFDSVMWGAITVPATRLDAIWGSGPRDVFAAGTAPSGAGETILHYTGSSWTPQPLPAGTPQLFRIAGAGPNDVFAVGANGTILRYVGSP